MGQRGGKSRSLPCFLSRRADVELCLVMQMLTVSELLRFARCNRQLQRAADSDFAFRHATIRIDFARLLSDPASIQKGLARHASVVLSADERIVQLPQLSFPMRIAELDVTTWLATDASKCERLLLLLDLPALQHLRVLRLDQPGALGLVGAPLFSRLIRLPDLQSLTCTRGCGPFEGVASPSSFPALTSLAICDSFQAVEASVLPIVSACPRLLRLSLHFPCFYNSTGDLFFASKCARRLQYLHLHFMWTQQTNRLKQQGLHMPSWAVSFAMLQSLTELELSCCYGVESLLDAVSAIPPLRRLSIQPNPSILKLDHETFPRLEAVTALLTKCPQLDLNLLLLPIRSDHDSSVHTHLRNSRLVLEMNLEAIDATLRPRITVIGEH